MVLPAQHQRTAPNPALYRFIAAIPCFVTKKPDGRHLSFDYPSMQATRGYSQSPACSSKHSSVMPDSLSSTGCPAVAGAFSASRRRADADCRKKAGDKKFGTPLTQPRERRVDGRNL